MSWLVQPLDGKSSLDYAWRSSGVLEPPPFPDPGICFWDSSDTVCAVTERALLGGMRCRAHALVVAQGLGLCLVSACSLNAEGLGDLLQVIPKAQLWFPN